MDELIAMIQDRMNITPALGPDTPLLSSGLVDSFHFVDLLYNLEELYRVRIDPADIGVDNFDTPMQIYAFINQQGVS